MIQFDEHIFQMGWFNHQLVPSLKTNGWNLKNGGLYMFLPEMLPYLPINGFLLRLQPTDPNLLPLKQIPSRELTYPTLGKAESSTQKRRLVGDMLVSWRVIVCPENRPETLKRKRSYRIPVPYMFRCDAMLVSGV